MLVTAFATSPQGQQLSSVRRQATVAWRNVRVGVPSRVEYSPSGGLGEVWGRRLGWDSGEGGRTLCCAGRSIAYRWLMGTLCARRAWLGYIEV